MRLNEEAEKEKDRHLIEIADLKAQLKYSNDEKSQIELQLKTTQANVKELTV